MPMPEAPASLLPLIEDSRQHHALMVLRSANGRRCAKHFVRAADGTLSVTPYDRESHWFVDAVPCPNSATFMQALSILTACRDRIVIRGALRDDATAQPLMRRCIGMGAAFQPALRSWVALDVDGLPVASPALGLVLAVLPVRFRGVSCFYQFTSSYGVTGELTNMRVRLWFQLSAPMSDAAWKRVLKAEAPELTTAPNCILDLSLFNPVQPHYIAAPTFEGMTDPLAPNNPCTGRSGVYEGASSIVNVDGVEHREEMDMATTVIAAITRTGINAHPDQIATVLAQFATRTRHASRHATAVALIGELYGHGLSGEEAMRHTERYMVQQGRRPERGELARALDFVVRRAEAGQLRTNDTPISLVFEEVPNGTLSEAPITPEEAVANVEANDEATGEWPAQPNSLARRAFADLFAGEGFIRWGKQDFEWSGAYWRPMADDEELVARIQRAAQCTPTAASRGAEALRNERHRAHLRPPCLLVDGTPVAPRIPVRNGWLSVEQARTHLPGTALTVHPFSSEVFDTIPPMPVSYHPNTACPAFTTFLDQCFEGDEESRATLIRLMGYLLFKGNEYQRVFICSGAPASGKSTWLRVMRALLGPTRAAVGDLRSFATDFGLASVFEAQALFLPESSHGTDGSRLNGESVDQLKRISGGDPVTVRRKYLADVTAEVMPTPVLICNAPPVVRDEAFVRRLVTVHFPHSFVGREDPTLTTRLLGELEDIFNVCLQGLARIGHERDPFPPPAAASTDDHETTPARELFERVRADSSPIAEFTRRCLCVSSSSQFISVTTLHHAYRRWCAANSFRTMDERQFQDHMRHVQITGSRWARRRIAGARVRGLEAVDWTIEGARVNSDTSLF